MKKLIGYIGAYGCYYIGDFFCRIGYKLDYLFLYNLYNKFMLWSSDIQDWAKLDKPWKKAENNK